MYSNDLKIVWAIGQNSRHLLVYQNSERLGLKSQNYLSDLDKDEKNFKTKKSEAKHFDIILWYSKDPVLNQG